MALKPTKGRVIVRKDTVNESEGGILLPKDVELLTGEVVAANESGDLKQGDKVLFRKFSGTEFEEGGESLWVMSEEEDIIAVIE